MGIEISLKELVESMEIQSDEVTSYMNTLPGEIEAVTDEELGAAEQGTYEDLTGVETPDFVLAVLEGRDSIALPTRMDINEYQIMEKFAESVKDSALSDRLAEALVGRGAFRRFKDAVFHAGVEEDWYKFKFDKYAEVAIDWCETNSISYRRP